ncbi:FliO/MopB family protein [Scatolibacter rhodanostii]|uniref:FliO/MopB family protein n=1 Tax=Scatolibacter rhodanostii TaxID=2014781 RepID=UPI000C07153F|nr:flagellar biosynthetic protein FliO [Scatolibacter rhodanostii]
MENLMPILSSIGTLLLIVAIFVGAYYVSKYLGSRYQSFDSDKSGNIELIEKKAIGKDQSLLIVRIADKTMLLGVTPQSIQKIEELDSAQITEIRTSKLVVPDFNHVLKDVWKKATDGKLSKKGNLEAGGRVDKHEKF